MPATKNTNLVWIDLEMTGLNVSDDRIIEIATIITDGNLEIAAEGPDLIIHQNNNVLKKMDGTVREMHEKSGLTEKVRASNISEHEAEDQTLNFIKQYVESKSSPLCGNSIYMDRTFISKYFPEFEDYLHYRLIDVSTIKELYKRWFPQRPEFKKKKEHRALDDIKESIAELKFYRENIFISPS